MLSKILVFFEKIFGVKNIFYFTIFEGRINRNQFFCTVALIYFCLYYIETWNSNFLEYISMLLLFPWLLATVQKRCCDFGVKGTGYIFAYTIFFIVFLLSSFTSINEIVMYWRYIYGFCHLLSVIIFITLSYKPSNSNPNMSLRSPLLKYPLLYTAICWVVAISATLIVNYYNGVSIF